MSDPVTVFMLVVSGLLVVGAVGEQIFARTGVPAVIWLILLGILMRVSGIVPAAEITKMAPFFAALALVLVLFDAGRHLTFWTGDSEAMPAADRKRALLLALGGFTVTLVVVALFSMGLAALKVLPSWSWTHAFMLGSLLGAGAGEVFVPSLEAAGADAGAVALLRREAAITKALAVAGTVLFLDLMSPRVAEGRAWLALGAAVVFALAFGGVFGALWVGALQRMTGNPRSYLYTMAVMIAVYVLSEGLGGSGPLAVLVFGVALGNAEGILGLVRRRGDAGEPGGASVVKDVLDDHEGTIQFVRTLLFALVGLMLAPLPTAGPLVMGLFLGGLPLIFRLLVARFVLSASDHAERSRLANVAPRGMATAALATLALTHAVPGYEAMLTLVFAAVTSSVVVFTLGLRHAHAQRLSPGTGDAKPVVQPPAVRGHADAVRSPALADVGATGVTAAPVAVMPMPVMPVAEVPVVAAPVAMPPVAEVSPAVERPLPVFAAPPGFTRVVVPEPAEAPETKGRTVIAEAPARTGQTILSAPARGPLVGMQEAPAAGAKGRAPEVYMPTLPTIDAAKAHGENPLDSAMQRALSKRPQEVTPARPRTTGEFETPPPSFTAFDGGSEDDATTVLASLGAEREKEKK